MLTNSVVILYDVSTSIALILVENEELKRVKNNVGEVRFVTVDYCFRDKCCIFGT